VLIVLEGIDGCGKSTQAKLLAEWFWGQGRDAVVIREPGATPAGEKIREILLDPSISLTGMADLLLFHAARAQVLCDAVVPALQAGKVVIMDRFYHSTIAYQAFGSGLDLGTVNTVIDLTVGSLRPHAAILLDLPYEVALERRAGEKNDGIEGRGDWFLRQVYEGYRYLHRDGQLAVVDADNELENVLWGILNVLEMKKLIPVQHG